MPPAELTPARTARILYLGLLVGPLLFGGVALALLPPQAPVDQPILLYTPFALAAVLFAGGLIIRTRIPQRATAESEDEWWRVNLPRALMVWSLFEGPALFGAAMYLTLGTLVPLLVTGIGLVMLLLNSPHRLIEG
ncbi:MAG TPA: hypothetical protein VL853_04670 [Gemmatimonadales bacterium]|nr:hypothetical protein [Gemmatimonadales bacterium]